MKVYYSCIYVLDGSDHQAFSSVVAPISAITWQVGGGGAALGWLLTFGAVYWLSYGG